ncbi:hypothetical protein Cgig2_022864 [Carnegiea gigantea]|uniref:Uncharacterized protein n=1 Tax=Carnegiea gigantea TaxID=171969 RepID=A0A9Q1QP19_9CARY|nr:hypothetical protein Cgig2_022864 [Carnegiea gigantea]
MSTYVVALVGAMRYVSCLPRMRPMFTMVNHAVEVLYPWETDGLKLCCFGFLIILPSQLYSAIFTQDEAYVHRGKPWCAGERISLSIPAVVDPDYSKQARVVIDQLTEELRERMCGHDIRLKRSPTRHEKANIIQRLQASVNKLKATLLEKGHAVRHKYEVGLCCVMC